MYPDMRFVVYHSGFVPDVREGPFQNGPESRGTDTLIKSLLDHNVGVGSNVFSEIGASWRYLMKDPDQAAHFIGKLLLHVGEDNVVWGTDCLLFGAPQDQIQAFQSFQISTEFQEKYGYPALTQAIRAKIFGRNSARLYGIPREAQRMGFEIRGGDPIGAARAEYAENPDPGFIAYGPRTRAEFLRLARLSGEARLG
jgi:predicted TIM-barrel fold metal-dependent hydrolase